MCPEPKFSRKDWWFFLSSSFYSSFSQLIFIARLKLAPDNLRVRQVAGKCPSSSVKYSLLDSSRTVTWGGSGPGQNISISLGESSETDGTLSICSSAMKPDGDTWCFNKSCSSSWNMFDSRRACVIMNTKARMIQRSKYLKPLILLAYMYTQSLQHGLLTYEVR